jgi:hypothetical protein
MIEVQTNDSDSEEEFYYSGRGVGENRMWWRKSERIRLDKVKNIKISDQIMLNKKKLFGIFSFLTDDEIIEYIVPTTDKSFCESWQEWSIL